MNFKFLLLSLLFGSSFLSYGQTYYNEQENFLNANSIWAFGHHLGLDFNSGTALPMQTQIIGAEGSTSVADPETGQLLFYSNGGRCWNRNGQIMLNGDSLLGNSPFGGTNVDPDAPLNYSTTQGTCIVPVIDEPGQYYLFSLRGITSGNPIPYGTLFYSIVDMSLDNGLGGIVSEKKNIALNFDPLSEAMIAIPGNNCDVWLMVHHLNQDEFMAYHITGDGIDTTPVISTTTGHVANGLHGFHEIGGLAISPDRQKIVICNTPFYQALALGGLLIGQFDPATGQVSNNMIAVADSEMVYSACFSPDNSKLYYSTQATWGPRLVQFDVSVLDSLAIENSRVILHNVTSPFSDSVGYGTLRLYNDTIYMASVPLFASYPAFSRINQPNLAGLACDFQKGAVIFNSNTPGNTLGNDVVFPLPADTAHQLVLDTTFCSGQAVALTGDSAYSDYLWDDGSTSQIREVTQAGTYWVLNGGDCHYKVDTFVVEVYDYIPPVITVDEFVLRTTTSYASYQWMLNGSLLPGATQAEYTVLENGDYRVIISTVDGCTDTSEVYEVNNVRIADPGILGQQIAIYPNPAVNLIYVQSPVQVDLTLYSIEGKALKFLNNTSQISLSDVSEGIYLLKVYDRQGRLLKAEKIIKTL